MNKNFYQLLLIVFSLLFINVREGFGFDIKVENFYGLSFQVQVPNEFLDLPKHTDMQDRTFASECDAWIRKNENYAKQIWGLKKQYALSDWAMFQFSMMVVKKAIKTEEPKKRNLTLMLFLRSMGYAVTVIEFKDKPSIDNWGIILGVDRKPYFASYCDLDEVPFLFYDMQNERFVDLLNSSVVVFDFKENLQTKTTRIFNLTDVNEPKFPHAPIRKTLQWVFRKKEFSLEVEYNKNMLDYYRAYPQLGVKFYFLHRESTLLQIHLFEPLLKSIKEEKYNDREAVNFLLYFCLSLPYREDKNTPQGEKCNFPEETIFATYSDCEDRAVLLASMVEYILKIPVVGLQYKNHVSTGVHVSDMKDSDVRYKDPDGFIYLPCDPSFFNSFVGDLNPDITKELPTILKTKN